MKAAVVVFALTACGGDAGRTEDPPTPDAAAAGGADAAAGSTMDSGMDSGMMIACDVPITDLHAYLAAGSYKQFAAEPAVHPSSGPHFGNVRTYFNPLLDASLKAGDAEHPQCSAAVKELYGTSTTTVMGWSVSVKTSAHSDSGAGWYWYEMFGTGAPSEGNGDPTCTGCHASGKDYVRTAPLS